MGPDAPGCRNAAMWTKASPPRNPDVMCASLGVMRDAQLQDLAAALGHRLLSAGYRLVTAESCTAGWLAKAVTDVAGSSQWFECGYVTYSNTAKARDLGVRPDTLATHGAVSAATVLEMARGALERSGADVAVATSGIAGPDGGSPGKPVGTVWFALAHAPGLKVPAAARLQQFTGDREAVRREAVGFALQWLLERAVPATTHAGRGAARAGAAD